ncbi:lipoyl(octanoyl) transferase LIP2 [Ascoidea rubescens DSM 1968]|uniref:Octanoyltransferase n=1 Tax=Ascoidea rubescens DSM 1968 TaxID=1344418 RepID=A0A1D2VD44_9ASCO|nr:lipoyltransferase [Ascoidea rubescens DSM 1968]ODV59555.1 lipoyltransferase [Ascoidea rubescens DSM 1968]
MKIKPTNEHSNVLTHIHFKNIMDYEKGLEIQENFVRLNLDFKKIESKIFKNLRLLNEKQASIEDHNEDKSQINKEDELNMSDYEQNLVKKILADKPKPLVLTFEFNPIYTGGKREKKQTIDSEIYNYNGAHYLQVERGGQITFHGPGQLVAYPILDLRSFANLSPKCYVSILENSIISLLKKKFGITAITNSHTGVWLNEHHKIASIGIQIRRAITSHGIALNIDTDTDYFNSGNFVICGLPSDCKTVTIKELIKDKNMVGADDLSIENVAIQFVKEFSTCLGIKNTEFYSFE